MEGERNDKGGEEIREGNEIMEGVENQERGMRGKRKGGERSHMIRKTYEFAYLTPRDVCYITESVVRENKDPGRKEQEEEGQRKGY